MGPEEEAATGEGAGGSGQEEAGGSGREDAVGDRGQDKDARWYFPAPGVLCVASGSVVPSRGKIIGFSFGPNRDLWLLKYTIGEPEGGHLARCEVRPKLFRGDETEPPKHFFNGTSEPEQNRNLRNRNLRNLRIRSLRREITKSKIQFQYRVHF